MAAQGATDARWIVPDWPAPARVRAICSTRAGGVSPPPYDSLNLGDHVGDAPEAVAANRKLFGAALQARPVFLSQVHGWAAVPLAIDTPDGTQADGCITAESNIACTIMVADCLPVLFTTANGSAVAAAHAGWRGLAGDGKRGILETVCEQLLRETGSTPSEVLAWLGPCIGRRMFEVGAEVKAAFEANDPQAGELFRPRDDGKWLADLQGLARRRLAALGVSQIYGNDGADGWCTVTNPSRFFSYRRDRVCGRFAAAVWLA